MNSVVKRKWGDGTLALRWRMQNKEIIFRLILYAARRFTSIFLLFFLSSNPCSVKILGLLLTFVDTHTALSLQVEQQMRQFFGDLVFDTVIHNTISLAEAPSAGQSIFTYAPESTGATEYEALAEEVTNPEYKRKRKLPTEVSAIVEEVHESLFRFFS